MEVYTNQLKTAHYNIRQTKTKAHKKGEKTKIVNYCEDILTFDIEVTSAFIDENGKVISYVKGKPAEYWNSLQPLALCYIWQFSFNDIVYYGRELTDFLNVLSDLPAENNYIIWVHNLSYEFQFLCNIVEWKNVFAKMPRKPMKATPKQFPNITFRCSYMLTRLSLDSWGKQIGVKKHTGDLNYEIMRTPKTALSEKELSYCEYDCLVVYAGIGQYKNKYGSLFNIPLTQTGTVRQEVKARLTNSAEYVRNIKKLIPQNADEYKMLMQVFAGGYTHANKNWCNIPIYKTVKHFDFASSYPTCMIAFKYPMTKWIYTAEHTIPNEKTFDDVAYILHLKFKRLKSIRSNTYIQASKSKGVGLIRDNGRILEADELEITITEQDYLTIKDCYTWKDLEVVEVYKSYKDYLPKPFTEYILELYANKTNYKDVAGMEDIYLQSKQYINSMFGMCVTAIVQSNVNFDGEEWSIEKLTPEFVNAKLNKLRNFSPRETRYFLNYSWGCWVTAYARRNLWRCILFCDKDMLYCDTDSIFVKGDYNFDWYNKEITERLKKACNEQKLDFEKTHPKTPKGKDKPLGIFEREDDCIEFVTLGAKRYVERRASDKQLHLTVAGINKGAVALLNDDIENFTDGLEFDKDSDVVTKRLATYITDMPPVVFPDGYKSEYRFGINLRRTGYKLTLTDEYKRLIDYESVDAGELAESYINNMKGRF